MRKIYKKLTQDQKRRGVIFSSTLSRYRTEVDGDTVHEVTRQMWRENQREAQRIIRNLKDDKFFNESHFKYNIIRS